MTAGPLRVLFLCTGNTARSQMAEAILRHLAGPRVVVESAGSAPRPEIHPMAREAIRKLFGLEMAGQRPKAISDLFGRPFDHVIAVCDRAAQACPTYPGVREVVRWSLPDPAEAAGAEEERRRAFENSARDLTLRIRSWLALAGIAAKLNA